MDVKPADFESQLYFQHFLSWTPDGALMKLSKDKAQNRKCPCLLSGPDNDAPEEGHKCGRKKKWTAWEKYFKFSTLIKTDVWDGISKNGRRRMDRGPLLKKFSSYLPSSHAVSSIWINTIPTQVSWFTIHIYMIKT